MYQKERLDSLLEILNARGYVTVKQMMDLLHYSSATINRDLNLLEKRGLIKRTYGGAEVVEQKSVPLVYRYNKMRVEKRRLARIACEMINPGDTVFIDSTTTTQIMGEYIATIKDVTVITNNMALVSYLSQYGVRVICLGGPVFEEPHMLLGDITVSNLLHFHADKLFFSTGGVTADGKIWDSDYMLMHEVMSKNADKVYYLVDHDKLEHSEQHILFDFDRVDCVISDFDFPDSTKKRFSKTQFIVADKSK